MTGDPETSASRHILVLADRDWTHPQGGGSGVNIRAQVSRWVAWGHRVTVIAGEYPGAERHERLGPNLTVHRMGSRLTVFPRAAWSVLRGVGRDADVVLEVINGIPFLTPLWLRKPTVGLVHHVHRELYIGEWGTMGRFAAWVLETLPLRYLYRHMPVLTISNSARDDLERLGIPGSNISVSYLGVDADGYAPGRRARAPRLLFVGRLKQYKRIELVLDVLEAIPEATLDIVGDGDHRASLEAEIRARGLTARVRMHGHVPEARKIELYGEAWVALTASSSEGWSLTVIEAALCATPTAALGVGGLPESVIDGETGVLAHDGPELCQRVSELIADRERIERLGAAAERRARGFTWERPAAASLAVLEAQASSHGASVGGQPAGSDTARATGVAAATLAGHAISVSFTIIFARLLGATGYGSLAALVSAFIIVAISGSVLQVATAREMLTGGLGAHGRAAATLRSWTRTLLIATGVLVVAGVALRHALADGLGVHQEWAAAALLPTGGLWLLISVQRGALQGLRAHRTLGQSIILEGIARLGLGIVLVVAGAGITGAFLGTPLSLLAISLMLTISLRRRLGAAGALEPERRLRDLLARTWLPVVGVMLLGVLQNVDVIMVKHAIGGNAAGAYAATAVAARTVAWIAIGAGLYLLPEATRLADAGADPRRALRHALLVVGTLSVPILALFALLPHPLLTLAFGSPLAQASDQLPVLALAMVLLSSACLAVQYMLALGRVACVPVLLAVAVLEPFLLRGVRDVSSAASVVLALQGVAAVLLLALSFRPARRRALA